ncbi:MAG TPA: nucleotidyltransferase domain-containing protein, partial [Spirochaetia bacterium]|nr:nucleotidyltransferase domain-containing protein [Spirochaetia bacterium]
MTQTSQQRLIERIRADLPQIQAIYLYGSTASGQEHERSDVDLGVLLPHLEARKIGSLVLSDTRFALEELTGREVDLVNLRHAPIVLQKEVIAGGIRIYTQDGSAVDEYEMLVLSFYGKLNEERAGILD